MRGGGRLLPMAFAVLALHACGTGPPEPAEARVFAASSLTDFVEAIARQDSDLRVVPSFGASSALARQIRDGAPADVFLSASPEWMDFLVEADMLAAAPVVFARNRLAAIAPLDSGLEADDLATLLERLEPTARVAIADRGVPAGEYARAALETLGLLSAYRSHLVGQRDVRAVLHAVELGELDAGFVYATDAAIAEVRVLFAIDPRTYPPIEYEAALLRGARDVDAARRFLGTLQGGAARGVLADGGFDLP